MIRERIVNLLLVLVLLAGGGFAWWLQLRPELRVDGTPLAQLPRQLGSWQAEDIPVGDDVSAMLRADLNLQRVYRDPLGGFVWVYIGYYGTDRGGRPEHTPWVCYPSTGWKIRSSRVLSMGRGQAGRLNELEVFQAGQRRLVHFYYRSHRRTGLVGGLDQLWDRFVSRLLTGRADGALVRLSTVIGADEDVWTARTRLRALGRQLDAVLAHHWPRERPREGAAATAH